jgi:hypothetical protein
MRLRANNGGVGLVGTDFNPTVKRVDQKPPELINNSTLKNAAHIENVTFADKMKNTKSSRPKSHRQRKINGKNPMRMV